MWFLQAVVSFVKIDRVKTVHYLGIEKRVMTFFLYTFLLFVFSSMQQYMFIEIYCLIVNLRRIHEVKPYLLNNVKECRKYFLNSSTDFDKTRYFKDQKNL